jgi:hypothetical protein
MAASRCHAWADAPRVIGLRVVDGTQRADSVENSQMKQAPRSAVEDTP